MSDHTTPSPATGAAVHRLLDQAFVGVEMTPDAQDLKEEVRANLVARAAELEATGTPPADAARRAIDELGDVRELREGASAPDAPAPESQAAAHRRHRVRPRPTFVVRTVLLALVASVALVGYVLVAAGAVAGGLGVVLALGAAVTVPLGALTADALLQETTTNHPLPARRAVGFGAAVGAVLAALTLAGAFLLHRDATWALVVATLLLVGSIAAFSWLGATQTNRHKAWVRRSTAPEPPNRFEQEPEAAARFGIYTVAIWTLTLAVVVWLLVTADWWWAVLAFVGGFALWMVTLARMLFGARRSS